MTRLTHELNIPASSTLKFAFKPEIVLAVSEINPDLSVHSKFYFFLFLLTSSIFRRYNWLSSFQCNPIGAEGTQFYFYPIVCISRTWTDENLKSIDSPMICVIYDLINCTTLICCVLTFSTCYLHFTTLIYLLDCIKNDTIFYLDWNGHQFEKY